MKARAIFAVLWVSACGVAGDISSGSNFGGEIRPGTSSGTGGGGQGPRTSTPDMPPPMSNTNVCGDGGVCSTGACCGAACCTIDEMCCSDRCFRPSLNQPSCPL